MAARNPTIGSAMIDARAASSMARSASTLPARASVSPATLKSTCFQHLVVGHRGTPIDDRAGGDTMGVSRGEGQDVRATPAASVHGDASDAQAVEDRGEVVGVFHETPTRQPRGGAEAGALDHYDPQTALNPG